MAAPSFARSHTWPQDRFAASGTGGCFGILRSSAGTTRSPTTLSFPRRPTPSTSGRAEPSPLGRRRVLPAVPVRDLADWAALGFAPLPERVADRDHRERGDVVRDPEKALDLAFLH